MGYGRQEKSYPADNILDGYRADCHYPAFIVA